MMTRKDKLLTALDAHGQGLEIGPLCWPVLSKTEARIKYVDHVSTADLKRLYKDDASIPHDQIVDIDFPLYGKSLLTTVGTKRFDYIIASHVIEHLADTVSWLQDMASVLRPGGVLSLAIPDKRYTFDIDRAISTPASVIGAYVDRRVKPDAATVLDYATKYRKSIDPALVWEGELYLEPRLAEHRFPLAEAYSLALQNRDTDTYVDTHCTVFTPAGFFTILRSLMELQLLPFSVESFVDTADGQYEFFVSLKKQPKTTAAKALLATLPRIPSDPTDRELQAVIRGLEQQNQLVSAELQHVLHSKSWQVTEPLRRLLKLSQRLRQAFK